MVEKDTSENCLFAGLVIGRTWCDARNAVAELQHPIRHEEFLGRYHPPNAVGLAKTLADLHAAGGVASAASGDQDTARKELNLEEKAIKAIDELEKQMLYYNKNYCGGRTYDEKAEGRLVEARKAVRDGNYHLAMDELSEAL